MLCPLLKNCTEYQTRRKYSSAEKWRCHYKEYWSKCAIFTDISKKGGGVKVEET